MKNYYQTLGVEKTATPEDIKKAYRRLASKHHPDKGGDNAKFQELQEAYDTLSDPQKRSLYDSPAHQFNFNAGGMPPGFDFDSIFDIFGARFHPNQARQSSARMSLWITLQDVARGGKRSVSVSSHSGVQAVEIEIPQGMNDGDTIQYSKIGPGGIDLIITFRIHPNPQWRRDGLNLTTDITVDIWDLVLGGNIEVRDILGSPLNISVPQGTQPNSLLRCKSRGLPSRGGTIGDMFVKIQARIPEISEELLNDIRNKRNK